MDDELLGDAGAELVGAFTVTFFAAGSLIVETLSAPQGGGLATIAATTGVGYALAVAITAPRSGGHVNPIVSVAAWLTARIEATRAGAYVLAQLLGGVLAALVLTSLAPEAALGPASHGATVGTQPAGMLSAISWEIVIAFFYTVAVFATVLDDRAGLLGPAAAGGAAFLAVAIALPFTGASFNPARSLGPALLAGEWSMHWVYWAGPLLGGALGGAIYDGALQPSPEPEEETSSEQRAGPDVEA